jgi:hypothetical protein
MTAPLASVREGSPYPVARLSVEAVANAFVVLGLLSAAQVEEILTEPQPVLEAAGFRVGREIGELSVSTGARGLVEARAAGLESPRQIPLAVGAGPVRCSLRRHELAITWATVTPEGIRLRYLGDARDGNREAGGVLAREVAEDIAELSITDDAGGLYRVLAANVPGGISGYCTASGETRWIPEGEFLAEAVRGGGSAVRWLEVSAGAGTPPVRFEIPAPGAVRRGSRGRPGRPRRNATWTSSHHRTANGRSAPSRPARWNSTPRPSWRLSLMRWSPSARYRRTARCSRASRRGCGLTGGSP